MKKYLFMTIALLFCLMAQAQIVESEYSNGKWGFIDASGKWLLSPAYKWTYWDEEAQLGQFSNEDPFTNKNLSRGLCDEWGKIIFPIGKYKNYVDVLGYDNLILVEDMQGLFGVATKSGKFIVPCKYKHILHHNEGFHVQDKNDLLGLLKHDGTTILACRFKSIYVSHEDSAHIYVTDVQGNKGLYAMTGKEVIPCQYASVHVWTDEDIMMKHITVKNKQGQKGAFTYDGKPLIPCKWKDFNVDMEDECIVVKDEKGHIGLYSLQGELIANCEYEKYRLAGEGIYLVQLHGKYGYCANGKEVIPCIYDDAGDFKNGVATVKKDGEVLLIKNPLRDASTILIAKGGVAKGQKKKSGPAVSRYPAPDSDVDKDIPTAKRKAENTFAFIIANENYADAPVPYSLNDGRMFREYCSKALGLPEKNINMYEDATFGTIITAVEKMKEIADAYEGEASVIFYYAGHGFPDDKQQSAYLLPIDGDASSITTTGYSLAKLYKEMASLKLRSAVVFMDACFSGARREDKMLTSSRGVAIKVKSEVPQGNLLVFSAAQGDETAHQMEEKHHGLFTYFLLKELQATGGDVDMGTLTDYVTKQVKRQSVVINNKRQTPTVVPSANITNRWRTMKLK